MPQISRIKLDKKTEDELVKTLSLIFTKIKTNEDMDIFLLSILSRTEKLMLAKRLAAMILIKEKVDHSQISASLHLTRATIAKLELFLEVRGQGYEVAFKVLEKEKIFKEIKQTLIKLAGYSVRAAGGYVKPTIV